MFAHVVQSPTQVLVVQLHSFGCTDCEYRGKQIQGLETLRSFDFLGFLDTAGGQVFLDLK
jgi:hypothetical protein